MGAVTIADAVGEATGAAESTEPQATRIRIEAAATFMVPHFLIPFTLVISFCGVRHSGNLPRPSASVSPFSARDCESPNESPIAAEFFKSISLHPPTQYLVNGLIPGSSSRRRPPDGPDRIGWAYNAALEPGLRRKDDLAEEISPIVADVKLFKRQHTSVWGLMFGAYRVDVQSGAGHLATKLGG